MDNHIQKNPVFIAFLLAFVFVGLALASTFAYIHNTQTTLLSIDSLFTFLIILGIVCLLVLTGTFVMVNVMALIYRLRVQSINRDTKVYQKMAAELRWQARLASIPRVRKAKQSSRRSSQIIPFPTAWFKTPN